MHPLIALKSGHWPSLIGSVLHLTVSFMVWLLIAAMSIPLAAELQLSDRAIAWLIALPLLGGALFRMIVGWSTDWIGARPTAIALLWAELIVLLWGWLGVTSYETALVFALALGVAGSSFAVALPIAGRAYPPKTQGFVLGIAATGNVGTVLILFLAPRWASLLDWHQICGLMAGFVAATLVLFQVLVPHAQSSSESGSGEWWHRAAVMIRQRNAYWLCFLYAVTFGGFVGLCSALPILLHDMYRLDAVEAGAVAALCGLVGSLIRPLGGYAADRQGGLRTLHYVLPVIAGAVVAVASPSISMAVAMLILTTGAMGVGNGIVFQLVAEWFPKDLGLASGVVGAAGGLGGFVLPLLMGLLKGVAGSYEAGLWVFAGFVMCAWGTVIVALRARSSSLAEPSS
ncbi:MFS transporter [Petrachloros mirabilis]